VNRRLRIGAFLLVAALAGFSGYYFNRARLASPATEAAAQKLMLLSFADLNGKAQTLSQWRGKVLVVNFWATWCPPCREEIPGLMRTQNKYVSNSVKVVGIALDNVPKVRDYVAEMSIDYSLLIGGAEIQATSKDLGNRAGVLPYTVILGRNGKVAYTHAGALTEAALDAALLPLL
jgi:thiol-disulfide isomerase/thioredoxin